MVIKQCTVKIRTTARDNYNLADWQLFQVHTMKWKNVELDGKNTEEIGRVTRQLIRHITEAKDKAISQTKLKTLSHPKYTVEMANIEMKYNY